MTYKFDEERITSSPYNEKDGSMKRQEKNVDKKPIDAEKKFSKLDANNDGNIDKDEFLNRKKGKKSKGKKVK